MGKYISDTNPETEEILIDLLRKKTIPERLSHVLSITSLTLDLSKRAIARNNPEKSRRELDILFVKYHYGEELAEKVNKYFLCKKVS
jgi:hypothetical protein